MPIFQIRAANEAQWLSAPFPPQPDVTSIIREWQKPGWHSELLVYPHGYMGNISPAAWRGSQFLLHVAADGESADVIAMDELPCLAETKC